MHCFVLYSHSTNRSMAYLPLLSVDWLVKSCHAKIDGYISIFLILFFWFDVNHFFSDKQEVSVLFQFFFWELKNIRGIEGSLVACPCRHIKSTLNKLIVCQAALKLNSYAPSLTFCPLSSSLEICSVSEGRQHSKEINDASVNMAHRAMLTQVVLFYLGPIFNLLLFY